MKKNSKSPLFSHIVVWKRYVDDIFGIFNGTLTQLHNFHDYLNTPHQNIKFTLEIESNDSLPFLDLSITKSNNCLNFNIYRKPTTTHQVIPFDSSSPMSHKLAAFRSLFNRLLNLPLNKTNYSQELNTILFIAKQNNFPFLVINNLFHKILSRHTVSFSTTLTPFLKNTTKYFSLPYIPRISEQLAHCFKTQCPQISISFSTSTSTIKSFISRAKDKINPLSTHGIYKLICPCEKFYIGRTIRNFQIRCKEHISQANNHLKKGSHVSSAFGNHLLDSGHIHKISENFKPVILHSGGNINFLNSLESLEILYSKKHDSNNILNNITEFTDNHFIPYAIEHL